MSEDKEKEGTAITVSAKDDLMATEKGGTKKRLFRLRAKKVNPFRQPKKNPKKLGGFKLWRRHRQFKAIWRERRNSRKHHGKIWTTASRLSQNKVLRNDFFLGAVLSFCALLFIEAFGYRKTMPTCKAFKFLINK
jgi:hypothetical protein